MDKIDLRSDTSYKAVSSPKIIEVPPMLFVTVEGMGAPETDGEETEFQTAMPVIYGIVYTIKFWDKQHTVPGGYAKFSTGPLEALWWSETGDLDMSKMNEWRWKVMMRLPDFVTPDYFNKVVEELCLKKQTSIFKKAQLETFTEGSCVQIMHIGPYDQEVEDIEKMHAFAKESGYQLTGKHHELYFSDPRRIKPEKLRTILRRPVTK